MSELERYRIREMYSTLQGEGCNTGAAVVLVRFEGCNLDCSFCDTDFTGTEGPGGGIWSQAEKLADQVEELWRKNPLFCALEVSRCFKLILL